MEQASFRKQFLSDDSVDIFIRCLIYSCKTCLLLLGNIFCMIILISVKKGTGHTVCIVFY